MSIPECGLCEGMIICSCKNQPIDKRFIAACHAMQGFLSNEDYVRAINYEDLAIRAVKATDALIAELEKK